MNFVAKLQRDLNLLEPMEKDLSHQPLICTSWFGIQILRFQPKGTTNLHGQLLQKQKIIF